MCITLLITQFRLFGRTTAATLFMFVRSFVFIIQSKNPALNFIAAFYECAATVPTSVYVRVCMMHVHQINFIN